jgi:hypothetical protein
MNLRNFIFPIAFFVLGMTGWLGSYVFDSQASNAQATLTAAKYKLLEPPALNRPPEEGTRSRRSRVFLTLQGAQSEALIAVVDDVAVLPSAAILSALLALKSGETVEVQMDQSHRVWSLVAAGKPIITVEDIRATIALRQADSIFGLRFMGSFFILLGIGLAGYKFLRTRYQPRQSLEFDERNIL